MLVVAYDKDRPKVKMPYIVSTWETGIKMGG